MVLPWDDDGVLCFVCYVVLLCLFVTTGLTNQAMNMPIACRQISNHHHNQNNTAVILLCILCPPPASYTDSIQSIQYYRQRGIRRGRLTPALAPRMPAMAEDAGNPRP